MSRLFAPAAAPPSRESADFQSPHISDFADDDGLHLRSGGAGFGVAMPALYSSDTDALRSMGETDGNGSMGSNRLRIDSLQSLPEEDFLEAVRSAYPKRCCGCNRRRCVLAASVLLFAGAAAAAVVGFALRPFGGQGLPPSDPSPPGSEAEAAASSSPAGPSVGGREHPLDAACSRRDVSLCSEKCGEYGCCSVRPDEGGSCAVSRAADCVKFWDLCGTDPDVDASSLEASSEALEDASTAAAEEEADGAEPEALPPVKLDLSETCSESNLSTSEGRNLCQEACREHMCCFVLTSPTPGVTCEDDEGMECDTYGPCGNLAVVEAEMVLEEVEENQKETKEEEEEANAGAEHEQEGRADGGPDDRRLLLRAARS